MGVSSRFLISLSAAAQGSAYLLTHRSWTSRIGTGFRKWSFSRPRRREATRPASSSTLRCFITPKRVIGSLSSSALRLWPSCSNSSSSRLRRVGSASALNTSSMPPTICDRLVTCQARRLQRLDVVVQWLNDAPDVAGGVADRRVDAVEALVGLLRQLDTPRLELLAR